MARLLGSSAARYQALAQVAACAAVGGRRVHGDHLRRDQRAGTHPLQSVDDDALAGLQAAASRPAGRPPTRRASPRDRPPCCRRSTTMTNFLFWSVPTARSLTSKRRLGLGLAHAQPRELAGHQMRRPHCRIRRARAPCRCAHRPGCRSTAACPRTACRCWSRVVICTGMRSICAWRGPLAQRLAARASRLPRPR